MHRPGAECAQNAGKVGRTWVPLAGQAQSLLPPPRIRLRGQVAACGGSTAIARLHHPPAVSVPRLIFCIPLPKDSFARKLTQHITRSSEVPYKNLRSHSTRHAEKKTHLYFELCSGRLFWLNIRTSFFPPTKNLNFFILNILTRCRFKILFMPLDEDNETQNYSFNFMKGNSYFCRHFLNSLPTPTEASVINSLNNCELIEIPSNSIVYVINILSNL